MNIYLYAYVHVYACDEMKTNMDMNVNNMKLCN